MTHDGVTTFRADLVPQLRFSGDFLIDTLNTVSPGVIPDLAELIEIVTSHPYAGL